MLLDAFVLASLTVIGCIMVYGKLPRAMRRFLEKHALLTDLIALALLYWLFGGTLMALFAAAIAGIMISIMLYVANNETKFTELYKMKKTLKEWSSKFLNGIEALASGINGL